MKKKQGISKVLLELCDKSGKSPAQMVEEFNSFSDILQLVLSESPLGLKVRQKLFGNREPSPEEFILTISELQPKEFSRLVLEAGNELQENNKPIKKSNKILEKIKNFLN